MNSDAGGRLNVENYVNVDDVSGNGAGEIDYGTETVTCFVVCCVAPVMMGFVGTCRVPCSHVPSLTLSSSLCLCNLSRVGVYLVVDYNCQHRDDL